MSYVFAAVIFGALLSSVIWLASKQASKEAQLQNLLTELKKQAEEQKRAQRIIDNVSAMSADDARKRLHEIANKQC